MLTSIVSLMYLPLLVSTSIQCRSEGTTFSFISILTQPTVYFAKTDQTKKGCEIMIIL